jgi:hypothetical protein
VGAINGIDHNRLIIEMEMAKGMTLYRVAVLIDNFQSQCGAAGNYICLRLNLGQNPESTPETCGRVLLQQ